MAQLRPAGPCAALGAGVGVASESKLEPRVEQGGQATVGLSGVSMLDLLGKGVLKVFVERVTGKLGLEHSEQGGLHILAVFPTVVEGAVISSPFRTDLAPSVLEFRSV